jgi:hypothetical protein
MFIVFRKPIAPGAAGTAARSFPALRQIQEISGPWQVQFDPAWGGPNEVVFETLTDWTKRPEDGIRFYSGKATYRMDLDIPEAPRGSGRRVFIDLGKVRNVADVRLNGKDLGVVWTAPWRVDVAKALQPGANRLEIDVVNLWPNRVIGDAALPTAQTRTVTNVSFPPGTPLLESGLLGPVTLQVEE